MRRYKPAPAKLKPGEPGARMTSTKRNNGDCPAKVTLRRTVRKDGATSPWRVVDVYFTHNHKIAEDPMLQSAHITPEEAHEIRNQRQAGVTTSALVGLLQQRHDSIVTAQTVYNALRMATEQYKDGRTDAQVLLDQLEAAGVACRVCMRNGFVYAWRALV